MLELKDSVQKRQFTGFEVDTLLLLFLLLWLLRCLFTAGSSRFFATTGVGFAAGSSARPASLGPDDEDFFSRTRSESVDPPTPEVSLSLDGSTSGSSSREDTTFIGGLE